VIPRQSTDRLYFLPLGSVKKKRVTLAGGAGYTDLSAVGFDDAPAGIFQRGQAKIVAQQRVGHHWMAQNVTL